jgi:DNA-binding transcriptional LysR family regulator
LRLTCGVTFGVRYLAPAMADFAARHPAVIFDLDLSDRPVDLVEEGFDLAIRIGPLRHHGLAARKLGETQIICCAAPAYLAKHAAPLQTPADLLQHECLSYANVSLPNLWEFESRADGRRVTVKIPLRHRSNNGRLLTALGAAGLGILFEPDFIVAPEIRSGRLVRLLPDYRLPRSPITAMYPSRRHLSPKVRSFVDFLAERFARVHDWNIEEP